MVNPAGRPSEPPPPPHGRRKGVKHKGASPPPPLGKMTTTRPVGRPHRPHRTAPNQKEAFFERQKGLHHTKQVASSKYHQFNSQLRGVACLTFFSQRVPFRESERAKQNHRLSFFFLGLRHRHTARERYEPTRSFTVQSLFKGQNVEALFDAILASNLRKHVNSPRVHKRSF